MLRVVENCLETIRCDSIQPKWLRPIYLLFQNSGMVVMCRNSFFYTTTWCRGPHTRTYANAVNISSPRNVFQTATDHRDTLTFAFCPCLRNRYVITRPRTPRNLSRKKVTQVTHSSKFLNVSTKSEWRLIWHTGSFLPRVTWLEPRGKCDELESRELNWSNLECWDQPKYFLLSVSSRKEMGDHMWWVAVFLK